MKTRTMTWFPWFLCSCDAKIHAILLAIFWKTRTQRLYVFVDYLCHENLKYIYQFHVLKSLKPSYIFICDKIIKSQKKVIYIIISNEKRLENDNIKKIIYLYLCVNKLKNLFKITQNKKFFLIKIFKKNWKNY